MGQDIEWGAGRLGTGVRAGGVVVALALAACSGSDVGPDRSVGGATAGSGGQAFSGGQVAVTGGDGSGVTGGTAVTTGGTGMTGGLLLGTGAVTASGGATSTGGTTGPTEDAGVCGMGTTTAERSPVNMLVMFDRSGSMERDGKWINATTALGAFFANPEAAGLRVALRFFPHDTPAIGCTDNGCNAMACEQPLVNLAELTEEPAPADTQEADLLVAIQNSAPTRNGGGTPIYAALDGALRWAAQNRMAAPDEDTVVIFVTDGAPNGCDEDPNNIAALASTALAANNIKTYAIGLEGSNTVQMDLLAMAGGTGAGIYIGSGNAEQELLDALNAIRSETLSCNIKMPEPTDPSVPLDPTLMNVTFTNGMGTTFTVPQSPDEPGCTGKAAWYYDDPANPTQIILCPDTCEIVRSDPAGKLEILLGCPTVCGGLDVDCGGGTVPPDVPPLLE